MTPLAPETADYVDRSDLRLLPLAAEADPFDASPPKTDLVSSTAVAFFLAASAYLLARTGTKGTRMAGEERSTPQTPLSSPSATQGAVLEDGVTAAPGGGITISKSLYIRLLPGIKQSTTYIHTISIRMRTTADTFPAPPLFLGNTGIGGTAIGSSIPNRFVRAHVRQHAPRPRGGINGGIDRTQ